MELQGTQSHAAAVVVGGRYELRGVLGRGAMAEVRDGWDLKLSRPVAIKLLDPALTARPESRPRFEAEARAAAQLTGRHVVVVHDVGEHDGLPFIVMERLPGVSLADHIARGPLPCGFVLAVLGGVLDALAEAHRVGILHRDVKPGNVLFTATGEPKLSDFGIAKTAGAAYTRTGEVVGSMAYMSPERLMGKPATVADDLYSVGVVGYEALAGRRPFPQEDLGPLAHAILHESPPPLAALRPDLPPGLVDTIERAMARDPAWRFDQTSAMRAALVGAPVMPAPVRPRTRVMTAPVPAYTPAGARLDPDVPRRKLWIAAIIALFVLALMLFLLDSSLSSSPPPMPADTTTPSSPPTTMLTTTPSSTAEPLPPPPAPHPGPPGKKHKGGKGG
ncbi:serine/threonine-protein kinase [Mycobacterium sp. E3198]|uniref:serine/threonine-protein kinase n=1 Tax=Mycobacterium sp. E3198 TaxID=1834143 RepID=UPI0007FBD2BB|nr:serine/threonine-protein kinase [Mycobacterium sp. E3198]OBG41518.1 protein kinase [Mycobacterium sp. E3198]